MIEHPCSAPRALALAAVCVAAAGFPRSVRAAVVQPKSDLEVVLTRVTPNPAHPGESVVFHASVTNLGPDAAPNVFLSLITPINASLGDGGGPGGGWNCIRTTDLVCSTASLGVGATATPFVVEFVPKDTSVTPMVATASVASDDLDDENPDNNTATVETDVAAPSVPVSWQALSIIGVLLGAAGTLLARR